MGLISYRINLFDLLAVQRTSRIFSSTIIQKHQFFGTQPSYGPTFTSYRTTGKAVALTILIYVRNVMSLLFNTLFRFVTNFLLRSKHFCFSWLVLLSTVMLESRKENLSLLPLSHPSICCKVIGPNAMIFSFVCLFNVKFQESSFTLLFNPHQEAL